MKYRCLLGFIILISMSLLPACLPEGPLPTNTQVDAAVFYTQAAETIEARLTADAQSAFEKQTQVAQTAAVQMELAVQTVTARTTQQGNADAAQGITPTSVPFYQPSATASPSPQPLANCDRADFLGDLTPTLDDVYYPGEVFRVSWRFQNVGTCTWTPDYRLEMVSGDFRGGTSMLLPDYVRPGQTIDLNFPLVAPSLPGNYIGYWNLKNSSGKYFGVGPNGEAPLTILAQVYEQQAGYSYDFATNYCGAEWRTGAGIISCLGVGNEEDGLVILMQYPILENNTGSGPALWTHPNNNNNGWISGIYPPILIQRGDRFRTTLGCLADSPGCDIILQVEYENGNGVVQMLGQWREIYDGNVTNVNIDLSPLAGQSLKFIFTLVVQNNQPLDANGVWVFPRIGR